MITPPFNIPASPPLSRNASAALAAFAPFDEAGVRASRARRDFFEPEPFLTLTGFSSLRPARRRKVPSTPRSRPARAGLLGSTVRRPGHRLAGAERPQPLDDPGHHRKNLLHVLRAILPPERKPHPRVRLLGRQSHRHPHMRRSRTGGTA